jgi:putative PIN family toxin of toxin-antitoxin system
MLRAVIDTNVVISGVFWKGPPYRILQAWVNGSFIPLLSPEVIDEYKRVIEEVCQKRGIGTPLPILDILLTKAQLMIPLPLHGQICDDPDDDKFLSLAASGAVSYVVSGDKALLRVKEYQGCSIVTANHFLSKL